MVINNKYELGQTVYLITDTEQLKRLVICIQVDVQGILYEVVCGTYISKHYDIELSAEENVTIKTT